MELKIVTKGIKKKKFFMPENVEAIKAVEVLGTI